MPDRQHIGYDISEKAFTVAEHVRDGPALLRHLRRLFPDDVAIRADWERYELNLRLLDLEHQNAGLDWNASGGAVLQYVSAKSPDGLPDSAFERKLIESGVLCTDLDWRLITPLAIAFDQKHPNDAWSALSFEEQRAKNNVLLASFPEDVVTVEAKVHAVQTEYCLFHDSPARHSHHLHKSEKRGYTASALTLGVKYLKRETTAKKGETAYGTEAVMVENVDTVKKLQIIKVADNGTETVRVTIGPKKKRKLTVGDLAESAYTFKQTT